MIIKIYISIINNGDGSASTVIFYDEDCALIHQRLEEEGWAEDCVSELAIQSDSPISISEALTRAEFIEELEEEMLEEWTSAERKNKLKNAIALLNGDISEETV